MKKENWIKRKEVEKQILLKKTIEDGDSNQIGQAYFNLACEVVRGSLVSPKGGRKEKKRSININKKFANSVFLKIFCGCSDSFNFDKVSQEILKKNREYENNINNSRSGNS